MQLENMISTIHLILTLLALKFVNSEVQRGNYRRDDQPLQDETPIVEKQEIDNKQGAPSVPAQSIEKNVQLITPNLIQPNEGNDQLIAATNPIQPNKENIQQIIPSDPGLQEIAADVHGADGKINEAVDPAMKLHSLVKTKVATHKVQQVQDDTAAQWPMGIVPYAIDKNCYDAATTKRIVQAMSVIESSSCVLFKELKRTTRSPSIKSNTTRLHFTNPKQERECVHETSTSFGGIMVTLGFECLHPDEILHSILHGIGFKDEVSHPHRDQYIRVMWENIQPKYRPLFRIQYEDAPYKLVEYDPLSIMHFHDRAFSANGAATIAPRIPGLQIGSSASYPRTLSQLDIMKLKLAFGHECNKRKIGDLLDTCKKALLPKHSDEQEEPGDTENGKKDEEGDKNNEDEGDENEYESEYSNENSDEKDINQDLRRRSSEEQSKKKHNPIKSKAKESSVNAPILKHRVNKTTDGVLKTSQRRGRYSYYRRG